MEKEDESSVRMKKNFEMVGMLIANDEIELQQQRQEGLLLELHPRLTISHDFPGDQQSPKRMTCFYQHRSIHYPYSKYDSWFGLT